MSRRDDAPRDLLFGLLALQNGMVSRDQLVAAFAVWNAAAGRPLADLLAEQAGLGTDEQALLAALVKNHLTRHGDDPERSLAALDVQSSTRESLAAAGGPVAEATMAHVGSGSGSDGDADRTTTYAVGTSTSDGQRFRVLRPHAQGGLGAVFVALDGELHREVALKQILDRHADDPVSRQRFLIEAEITGGLEHPGIVPVYGLGTYGGGRPYYAMRFIKGDSLKEAIEQFHAGTATTRTRELELRRLLRRFLDVCNAIEYAHSRGVLHRDIKPGNVIVGKHGETLVVDWGLAKPLGSVEPSHKSGERTLMPSSASGSSETLPGSALGTPAYMSPEQAAGDLDRLGPRSDVYALGATLYCLLTGKAPFEGDAGSVLRKVQAGDFPHPRALDPSIDKALEAVCLKAMANRPEDRYASCRALADDVERWAADEPVSAYREPLARRARRWAKRNRTTVTAAGVALVAGVVGLAAVLAVQTRAKADIARSLASETRANKALAVANADLARSKAAVQARYDLAVEAIKTFHTGVSEDFLLKQDQFKELRDRQLKSASDFYGKLSASLDKETDLPSRRALAQSNFELAELIGKVGRNEDALAAHRAVLAAREALAADLAADADTKADVGRSLVAVARLLMVPGKHAEAEATARKAEASFADLPRSSTSARAALAACRSWLGNLLVMMGKPTDAMAYYRLARADQEVLAAEPGATNDNRLDLALTIHRTGALLSVMGRPSEAESEHRKSLAIRRKLADDNPAVVDFRYRMADSHTDLGISLYQSGKASEAETEFRAALAIRQWVADDNLAVTRFRMALAQSHNNLGSPLMKMGKMSEAEAEYRKGLAIHQRLADDAPAVAEFRAHLADSHFNLGILLSQMGQTSEAEAEYRKAQPIRRKLADDNPGVPEYRSKLVTSHATLAVLLSQTGQPPEAEAEYRKALASCERLVADNPGIADYRNLLASCHNDLSVVLRRHGGPAEARDGCERAIAIRETLIKEFPKVPMYRSHLAWSHRRRGLARRDLGDPAGSAADARRAVALWDGLPSRSGVEWFETACAHAALAGLAGQAGSGVSADEASGEADAAMSLLRKAVGLGHRSTASFRTEDALDPLRDRPDFRLLMMDLAMPADPFVRGQR